MTRKTIRDWYSDKEIVQAYHAYGIKGGAAHLSDGATNVSRQLFRNWLVDLGVHEPKFRGNYREKVKDELAQAVKAVGSVLDWDTPYPEGPRILSLDIETAPLEVYVWSLWKQNVGLNQITTEWTILSFCAKWLHGGDPIYMDCRGQGAAVRDDMHLLVALHKLLNEADIVIVQNGKRFDVPKINARFIMNGFRPPRPYKIIDTMLIAKQQFGFTSKKLEWMTDKLCKLHKKNTHAKFPGFELWAQCLLDNPEAWDEMRDYNIPDVLSMEELYLIMRPWFVGHPNVAIYFQDDEVKCRCPKCGDPGVKQDGWTYTQTGKYEQMHCGACGGWSRGRYTKNTIDERKSLLSN